MTIKRNEPVATIVHTNAAEEWATSDERLPIFTVVKHVDDENGETRDEHIVYTMPAKPNPGIALRYLKMARETGDAAASWLIEVAIGEEGYNALADELINYEGDPMALLRDVAAKIQTVVMGGLDGGPKA